MNCRIAEKLISAHIDGELSGRQAVELQDHLRDCASCHATFESEKRLKTQLCALALPELPTDFEARLQVAVFGKPQPKRWLWAGAVSLAAAACAAAFLYSHNQALKPSPVRPARTLAVENQAAASAADPFTGSAPVMLISNGR